MTIATLEGVCLPRPFSPMLDATSVRIPKMFEQSRKEQVDTLTHEVGHIFGLRHFFAPDQETRWPSEIFGEHKPFSIMNYGANSELTDADRRDLKTLYTSAWSKDLTNINVHRLSLFGPSTILKPEGIPLRSHDSLAAAFANSLRRSEFVAAPR